ncbi:molybdopterin molybdotransferase MoeA [Pilimelia columellifera]|uniref:Molybdopterin molybdenumtransferase n=1 Tax=Pilimelia columellifera subsp. columellifera TaxID=706583 RepID=A0ABN3N087_9ACTN
MSVDWTGARDLAHRAGVTARGAAEAVPIHDADGLVLADPLRAGTDLPAFATSNVDGWAVRGPGPWRVVGRVLAGTVAPPLPVDGAGVAVEIATGAMVPAGTEAILRTEESHRDPDGRVTGDPRPAREWRVPGDEATLGDQLAPAGANVTPALIGLAAAAGHDTLSARPRPRVAVRVFGDELLTEGPARDGRIRDALGPALPSWLRRLGADPTTAPPPIRDTLDAHVAAVRDALGEADLVCTTGGTMHGPVDHLHPALRRLGATYLVDTVAVRPGYPMLLASVSGPDGRARFVAGLPGNPQSAIIALLTLVAPLLAGLRGGPPPPLGEVTLGEPIPGRGGDTHLSLVRVDGPVAWPLRHVGSAMLRGLSSAVGFAVIAGGATGRAGDTVPLLPLPLTPGEAPR